MVLEGQLSVGLLEIGFGDVRADPEDVVELRLENHRENSDPKFEQKSYKVLIFDARGRRRCCWSERLSLTDEDNGGKIQKSAFLRFCQNIRKPRKKGGTSVGDSLLEVSDVRRISARVRDI